MAPGVPGDLQVRGPAVFKEYVLDTLRFCIVQRTNVSSQILEESRGHSKGIYVRWLV